MCTSPDTMIGACVPDTGTGGGGTGGSAGTGGIDGSGGSGTGVINPGDQSRCGCEVPGASGLNVFLMRIGMRLATAGAIVAECSTLAPK